MSEPAPLPSAPSDSLETGAWALAALLQGASLVGRLARTGLVPLDSYETSVHSLFVFSADRVNEIYSRHRGLTHGFRILEDLAQVRNLPAHAETLRYAYQVARVVTQLRARPELLELLRDGLEAIAPRERGGESDEAIASDISRIYQQTISTLPRRIQVIGDIRHLQNPYTAYRVRALLLACVRAAMLWRHVAGSWWKAFLNRRAILAMTRRYLALH